MLRLHYVERISERSGHIKVCIKTFAKSSRMETGGGEARRTSVAGNTRTRVRLPGFLYHLRMC